MRMITQNENADIMLTQFTSCSEAMFQQFMTQNYIHYAHFIDMLSDANIFLINTLCIGLLNANGYCNIIPKSNFFFYTTKKCIFYLLLKLILPILTSSKYRPSELT